MSTIVQASQYARLDRPALRYVVEGLIPKPGLTLLIGEPFCGKSFLALQIALAVAQGQKALGANTNKSPVLYLQFDTSELVWRDRFAKLEQAGVDISGPLYMIHPEVNPLHINIGEGSIQRLISTAIKECQPALIIIDVWREIHNRKEDSSGDMKIVMDQLLDITGQAAVLIIHHCAKLSNKEQIRVVDLPRGSNFLAGKADILFALIDGDLHCVSRIGEGFVVEGQRDKTGFWRFPALDAPAQEGQGG
jgi:RecA-family ATPase